MTPAQARAARAILRLSTKQVAQLAAVAPNTVNRVEQDDVGVRGPNPTTVNAIKRIYEERGIEFLSAQDSGIRIREGSKIG
ncbi:XRE family transcriptional regulator [Rhizobium sp. TH2]|uniref:XRE family transcriptional regulator n=1 Tax=Rhizobium sp. TH2 TaxID=2775403 RepID=UPI0021574B5E|nr:XRE family transcriptional regulator [Rhizobium sp. TH2]UVC07701.1 XRE family transcriptional regulator [Rhizobium sp. TH2]